MHIKKFCTFNMSWRGSVSWKNKMGPWLRKKKLQILVIGQLTKKSFTLWGEYALYRKNPYKISAYFGQNKKYLKSL